jgi:hypothetical protein
MDACKPFVARARCWCGSVAALLAICGVIVPPALGASLLPLATEQAETLPSGTAEAILGVTYYRNQRFPFFTPPGALRSQDLVAVPDLGFRIGAGGWAEIQASYATLYLDEQFSDGGTHRQFGSGDMRLFTKVRLLREDDLWPALGLRFGTKLPNASREARLGTDDTDFGADVLASKDLGPLTAHANLGLLLLGNSGPTIGSGFRAGGQDDVFSYAIAAVSPPLGAAGAGATKLRLLGEVAGLTASHFDNDRAAARVGVQLARGPGTIYIGASAGLIAGSEDIGASTGFIYTFEPGRLFGEE